MLRRLPVLLGLSLLTAACAGNAAVIGRSDDAILLRVAEEADVPATREQAAEHCAESYRLPVLVSTEALGGSVMAQWECR